MFNERRLLWDMALRILLADKSPTIKKIFQLALRDYAVEVCSAASGLDVDSLTEQFRPDIIFVDVFLQKKNGYDVSTHLKSSQKFKSIPVILMSNRSIDEGQFKASSANARLEKPFDVKTLRVLIQEQVPKTKTQTLSNYLDFPSPSKLIDKTPKSEVVPAEAEVEEVMDMRAMEMEAPVKEHKAPDGLQYVEKPPHKALENVVKTSSPKKEPLFDLNEDNEKTENPQYPLEKDKDMEVQDFSQFTEVRLGAISKKDKIQSKENGSMMDFEDNNEDIVLDLDLEKNAPAEEVQDFSKEIAVDSVDSLATNDEMAMINHNDEESPWEEKNLNQVNISKDKLQKFKVNLNPDPDSNDSLQDNEIPIDYIVPGESTTKKSDSKELVLDPDQLKEIISVQCREALEPFIKKIIPEIATQMIKEELKRLFKKHGESPSEP